MSAGVLIRDSLGERRIERQDFPLSLGGPGAAIVADAQATEPLGWIGLHDDALFLQPLAPGRFVHNGMPVERSVWLHAGDVVAADQVVVRVGNEAGLRCLWVEDGRPGNATAPPIAAGNPALSGAADDGLAQIARIQYRGTQGAAQAAVGRRNLRPLLWGATVAALLAVLWWLGNSVSVPLQLSPATAELKVSGPWPHLRIGDSLFLRTGLYTLGGSAKGYESRQWRLQVSDRPGLRASLELPRLPGLLHVKVPATGVFRTDNGVAAPVPGTVKLPAGQHRYTIEAAGFVPFSAEIEIRGLGEEQTLEPSLLANSAPVSISSEPTAAQVLIDGKPLGVTPLTETVAAGSHAVELRRAGFNAWTTNLLVKPGEAQSLGPVRLGLPDASVMVHTSPEGARVLTGGAYQGLSPVRLALRAEIATTLTLAAPGYEEVTRTLTPRPAAREELQVELKPVLGTVSLRGLPADADVFVDGVRQPRGVSTLSINTVAHKIDVRKSGFLDFSATVTPRPGLDQSLEVRLLTEQQQRVARVPPTLRVLDGLELRLMPTGRYTMGSSRREAGRRANESERAIELKRLFYMGVREVSNGEFRQFRAEHNSGQFAGVSLNLDNQPVTQVSWQDAVAFCNWLSQKESLPPAYQQKDGDWVAILPLNTGYRLPVEAEWEWVARYQQGGATARYTWGDSLPIPPKSGNYADLSARAPLQEVLSNYDDGYVGSAPVASFVPSSLGLHDLGGNVSEWMTDTYATSYAADAVAVDPAYSITGGQHAVRGASWRSASVADLRAASRVPASTPRDDLGFRIARYAE